MMDIDKLINKERTQSRRPKILAFSEPMCEQCVAQQKKRHGQDNKDAYGAADAQQIIAPATISVVGSPSRGDIGVEHLRQEQGYRGQQETNFEHRGKRRDGAKTK